MCARSNDTTEKWRVQQRRQRSLSSSAWQLFGLDEGAASACLRGGDLRVGERAGETRKQRCAGVAAEVMCALCEYACPRDATGHFDRACTALRARRAAQSRGGGHGGGGGCGGGGGHGGGGGGGGGGGNDGGTAVKAAIIDSDAIVAQMLQTVGAAQAGSSYAYKRRMVCLCTAGGASRDEINVALRREPRRRVDAANAVAATAPERSLAGVNNTAAAAGNSSVSASAPPSRGARAEVVGVSALHHQLNQRATAAVDDGSAGV